MKILSSDSRIVPCGWTAIRTDMMPLLVAFGNSANAPKNRAAGLLQYHVAYYTNVT